MDHLQSRTAARNWEEAIALGVIPVAWLVMCLMQHYGLVVHNIATILLTFTVFGALTVAGWAAITQMVLALIAAFALESQRGSLIQGWEAVQQVCILSIAFPIVCIGVLILRKRLQTATDLPVREERELFRAIMSAMHDSILETDWKGIREVNASFCRMTGFTREEIIGAFPPYPFWPIEDYGAVAAAMESSMRGQASDFALTMKRKTGEKFPVLVSVSRILDGERSRRVVFSFRDITELEQKTKRVEETERLLTDAIEAAGLGAWEYDVTNNTVKWSGYHAKLWGYDGSQLTGDISDFTNRVHPEDLPRIWAEVESSIQNRTPLLIEYRVRTREGGERWMRSRGTAIADSAGKVTRMVGIVQDITDRRVAELN